MTTIHNPPVCDGFIRLERAGASLFCTKCNEILKHLKVVEVKENGNK